MRPIIQTLAMIASSSACLARISRLVDEVGIELRKRDHATAYFESLRYGYIDDLARISILNRTGLLLEIGGYPFCFSICLKARPPVGDLISPRAK